MLNWTSIFVVCLICHGGHSKPPDRSEGEPEALRRELSGQNKEESGYVSEGLEFFGKLKIFVDSFI